MIEGGRKVLQLIVALNLNALGEISFCILFGQPGHFLQRFRQAVRKQVGKRKGQQKRDDRCRKEQFKDLYNKRLQTGLQSGNAVDIADDLSVYHNGCSHDNAVVGCPVLRARNVKFGNGTVALRRSAGDNIRRHKVGIMYFAVETAGRSRAKVPHHVFTENDMAAFVRYKDICINGVRDYIQHTADNIGVLGVGGALPVRLQYALHFVRNAVNIFLQRLNAVAVPEINEEHGENDEQDEHAHHDRRE